MTPIDEAIALWELYRKGVIAELENIPEEQWDYRPGPGARTLRELAIHIAGAAAGFTQELLASEPSFMKLRDPQAQAKLMASWDGVTGKADFVKQLTSSGEASMQSLRKASATLANQTMKLMSTEQSRLSGLWFAVAHEAYHRGQLATYARGMGLVPAMTKQSQTPPKA